MPTSVPVVMDNLLFGAARELPRPFFDAVADRDHPNGANFPRQAQDVLYLPIAECSDEAGAQTLVYHRQ